MTPARVHALASLALLAAFALPVRADGVRLALTPDTLVVAPGDTFTVQLAVPVAGGAFNGFAATVAYDPAVLAFVPRPQAEQEGPLLRGYCNNTFYLFGAAADSVRISDTMLCNGGFVTGPGALLVLRFVARGPTGATVLHLRRSVFYNDGYYVAPVLPSDAVVSIGGVLAAPHDAAGAPSPTVAPNPARGTCWIRAGDGGGPLDVAIFDLAGRSVRRLAGDAGGVAWDGRDRDGRLVPPGVYRARATSRTGTRSLTLVRLP